MALVDEFRAHLVAQAGLTALVGSRVYPLIRPQHAAFPHVVFFVISDRREIELSGAVQGLSEAALQVSAFDTSYSGLRTLQEQVRAALLVASTDFTVVSTSDGPDLYESTTRTYVIHTDLLLWHDNA